jgi:hypothetical protein
MAGREPDPAGAPLRRFTDADYRPLAEDLAAVRREIDRIDEQVVRLLAERLRGRLAHQPRDHVGRRGRAEGHEQLDRPVRVVTLRQGGGPGRRERGGGGGGEGLEDFSSLGHGCSSLGGSGSVRPK